MSASRRKMRYLVHALALSTLICACDDNPTWIIDPPPTSNNAIPIAVEWQHPFPQGNDLRRMWGFSDGSFYAVGEAGTVVRYAGSSWTMHETPTRADLHGIWASSPSDVYAAGFSGTVLHYDGTGWSLVPSPTSTDLYAVWASASNDVFVAGSGGSVWNRSGSTWTEYFVDPGKRFRALWGYAHNDVYVAGSNGTLYHFDGTSWTRIILGFNPQPTLEIRDLWGPAPGSLSLIFGDRILSFEGSTWTTFRAGVQNGYGLWGMSLSEQVAISAGLSTHMTNGTEAFYPTPTQEPLFDIWGRASNDYYAVGRYGNVAHFDGAAWAALNVGAADNIHDLHVGTISALAVGDRGTILRQNGSAWLPENVASGYDLAGVWDSGDGLSIAVGGYSVDGFQWRQAVLTNAGGGWTDVGAIGDANGYTSVWGTSATNVYVVGWGGEIMRYDGNTWLEVAPDSGDVATLRCVTGTSPTNVIAVGRTNDLRGLVVRYDGVSWRSVALASAEDLYSVWVLNPNVAFAVGSVGTILRFDGTNWSRMTSPVSEALFSVWGRSADDVFAAGWGGTILHYDGAVWRSLLPATNRNLNAIADAQMSGQILFAGDRGAVFAWTE